MNSDIARVPESRCLGCGALLNMLGTANPDVPAEPEPGSLTACIRCGAVMILDDSLGLRGLTEQEIREVASSVETMESLAHIVKGIRFIQHGLN